MPELANLTRTVSKLTDKIEGISPKKPKIKREPSFLELRLDEL
jgi:hypothetical protein